MRKIVITFSNKQTIEVWVDDKFLIEDFIRDDMSRDDKIWWILDKYGDFYRINLDEVFMVYISDVMK